MNAALAPTRTALGNRNFSWYLVASALADCGFWIAIVAQGWLVATMSPSPFWLGAIGAAAQSPALFMSLVGGIVADRFDRRIAIAIAEIGIAIVAIVTAILIARHAVSLPGLIALAFVSGTLLALEHPIDRAFICDLIEGDDVEHCIALSSLEFSVARTAGPAIGGVAIATVGIAGGYAMQAACVVPIVAFACYAIARGIAKRERDGAARTRSRETSFRDAWTFLCSERSILAVCILTAIFTIGISPYVSLLADIAKNVFHLRQGGYGALQASAGAGAFAGALALSLAREPKDVRATIVASVVAGALALAFFTTLRQPLLGGVALFAMGAVDAIVYALGNTYVQERTPERFRGRINAIFAVAFLGGIPVGNLVLGAIAARVGTEWTLMASSLVVAACAVAFWFVAPKAIAA